MIYMDHHAGTPVDPRVLDAMLPYFTEKFGNAASRNHAFGWEAEDAVEEARRRIAERIHADPKEIVFTSGATEADNLAIRGALTPERDHVVTSAIEHKAVLEAHEATRVPVDRFGVVGDVAAAITDRTAVVSVMHANNEIGTIQDIAAIGGLCKERGVLFHVDAAQSFGKLPIDVRAMNIHMLSISAHKFYGPKGVGALYVRSRRPRVKLEPLIRGGGHERGLRSGTLNVPAIVGFGVAATIEEPDLRPLRDRLHRGIADALPDVFLNGHPERRLAGNLNLSFAYVEAESLLLGLEGIAVSSGAACMSATLEPSYVLRAIGLPEDLAAASIRFGLGRFNTAAEVDAVIGKVVSTVRRLRDLSPLYQEAKKGNELASVLQRRSVE